MTKMFSLQQRIAYHLLDLLETSEIDRERVEAVSNQVLQIMPEGIGDDRFDRVVSQIETIPELKGLSFGLGEE